ncbi:sulfite oxidase cytochrome subunit [Nitratireductor pacificus pht-3B]|uniref:Sulfite oxidase cytochrome subunit n=1 Tax=Nitratireductor pacificus pht-3B TaxID=391937 RepID=K2M5E9_9HYPH|nr:sulfite oxidase cytochrome subunit [Nitratireductor pacificus pht-3B]
MLAPLMVAAGGAAAQDADAGAKVFNKCKACHTVGEGAKHRVGPELNALFGRVAGTAEGYKYSPVMTKAGADGLVWDDESLHAFLAAPRSFMKGTKMAFAGLKKQDEIDNLLAYLRNYSSEAAAPQVEEAKPEQKSEAPAPASEPEKKAETAAAAPAPETTAQGTHGVLHLGRPATEAEVAAWDIDVRPDGLGLPEGRGTVTDGEALYSEQCAACHGDFGEAIGRWPVLAGGQDTLTNDRPVKTIGSYWPYLSTVYDYIRRTMPFGNARSLSDDDVYALTAYVLYLNDVVTDEDFELSRETFLSVDMPNAGGFIDDDRMSEPHYANKADPCMKDCKPGKAEITMHAAVLDVTPEGEDGADGAPSIE